MSIKNINPFFLGISILPSEPTNLYEYIIPENVMEACRAVTRCWSILKSSFSCKNLNLIPLHSSWRGAKLLYSMIYIFRLLVSKNRGEQLDDTLLSLSSLSSVKVKKEGIPGDNLASAWIQKRSMHIIINFYR